MSELELELAARGVVVARGLLGMGAVERLRATFAALERHGVPRSREILYTHEAPTHAPAAFGTLMEQWLNPHLQDFTVGTRADAQRLGQRLLSEFGRPLVLFQDVILSKRPAHETFPWHQDAAFWPVDCVWGAIVWCALDEVNAENGAVEFAIGSHRGDVAPSVDLYTGRAQIGAGGALPDLEDAEVFCPSLAPGDAVIFHPRTFHRSGRNRSGLPRRAWASSWLSTDSRWDPSRAPRHPLAANAPAGALVGDVRLVGGAPWRG